MKESGRNNPCPCGSGKKYKKCCLHKDQIKVHEESRPFEDYFVDLPPLWGAKNSKKTETMDGYWYESRPGRMRSKHTSYGDLSKKLPRVSREQKRLIEDYWTDIPSGKRPKEPFRLISWHMEKFICENCKAILYIDGVLAVSFLQAVWYFADYLFHYGWMDKRGVQEVQSRCLDLYEECKKVLDDCDAINWMITDFPEMVIGS